MWSNTFGIGQFRPGIGILLAVVLIWSLVWKGLALWRAARAGSKWWFIAMLVINTVGILEILYIYVFSRKGTEVRLEETHLRRMLRRAGKEVPVKNNSSAIAELLFFCCHPGKPRRLLRSGLSGI